jgi:hypothetical protein
MSAGKFDEDRACFLLLLYQLAKPGQDEFAVLFDSTLSRRRNQYYIMNAIALYNALDQQPYVPYPIFKQRFQ